MAFARAVIGSARCTFPRIPALVGFLFLALVAMVFTHRSAANPAHSVDQSPAPATMAKAKAVSAYGKLPLSFEANQGQTDRSVKFLSRGKGYGLFLTGDEAVLTLEGRSQEPGARSQKHASPLEHPLPASKAADHGDLTAESVIRMQLVGANTKAPVAGAEELPGKSNYLIGNDPTKWRTDVPTYAQVKYQGVYPGVDLVYYGNQSGKLEYDFVVAPGADPDVIRLAVSGGLEVGRRQQAGGSAARNLAQRQSKIQNLKSQLDPSGDLTVSINGSAVQFHKPVVYQTRAIEPLPDLRSPLRTSDSEPRTTVDCRYVVTAENQIEFALGPYDHTRPVVIDPVITYSSFLGGSAGAFGYSVVLDSLGNIYIGGETNSTDYPTHGPYQATNHGGYDGFVTKLNPAGSAILYSTYVGGSGRDYFDSIALAPSNQVVAAGNTNSSDFPTLHALAGGTAYATGGDEAVAVRLNSAGNGLVYSTYLGGLGDGDSYGLAVDASGDAYVVGSSSSAAYPVFHAIQSTHAGSYDGTLSRLHWSGTALSLVYSTYWGGTGNDGASGVAVDSSGNVYVCGYTYSSNFPTHNPFQASLAGGDDAFVSKLHWNGAALSTVYSTFLGGPGDDYANALAIDSLGNAFVTGVAGTAGFPTLHPWQAIFGGLPDAFVAELNAAGTGLIFSTFFGGSQYDGGNGIALGPNGIIYVVGYTGGPGFPTVNAFQGAYGGGYDDGFITALHWNGLSLNGLYSTYLGTSGGDSASGLTVDSAGNAYVVGYVGASDFPIVSAYQATFTGTYDAFLIKISPGTAGPELGFSSPSLNFGSQGTGIASASKTETVTNLGSTNLTISTVVKAGTNLGDFAITGNSCTGATVAPNGTCTVSAKFTPGALGSRFATLEFTDNASGSPQAFDLLGTGETPNPVAGASPSSLPSFGSVNMGVTSASKPVTLSNAGGGTLHITNIAVSANFHQTNTCAGSVAGNSSCTINVTFTPTALGSLTGSLTITDNSNGVAGSTQSVSLSGTGLAAVAVTLSPSSASKALGGTQLFTATISNATNTYLNWYVNGVVNGSAAQGTLTGTGLTRTYTAPSINVPSPNPAVIKVASSEDATKYKTASVTVTDSIAVTLSPSTKTLAKGGTQLFTAGISGTTNTALNWYVNGVLNGNSTQGTLTGTGLTRTYTAPSVTLPSPNPALIKVGSQADPAKYKTASVTVN